MDIPSVVWGALVDETAQKWFSSTSYSEVLVLLRECEGIPRGGVGGLRSRKCHEIFH